jgi:hypothetical protein
VLGNKNRIASGREEVYKACAVSFGSNQTFCQCFSDLGLALMVYLRCLHQCIHYVGICMLVGWHRMVPFVELGRV